MSKNYPAAAAAGEGKGGMRGGGERGVEGGGGSVGGGGGVVGGGGVGEGVPSVLLLDELRQVYP